MTLDEFRMWLDGYSHAFAGGPVAGTPSPEQWKAIKAKLDEVRVVPAANLGGQYRGIAALPQNAPYPVPDIPHPLSYAAIQNGLSQAMAAKDMSAAMLGDAVMDESGGQIGFAGPMVPRRPEGMTDHAPSEDFTALRQRAAERGFVEAED